MGATPTIANAFTVDTEEWFHICGVRELGSERWDDLPSRVELTTRLLLEDMAAAGIRGTFLVVGWVAERYPHLVREILAAGHEVGSHGYAHQRVYELTPAAFRADLRRGIEALRAAGATEVRCYRAPEWSITERSIWALDHLASEGIRIDASMAPVKLVGSTHLPRVRHVRVTAEGDLIEMPPLVADRFGQVMPLGWGWGLRMSDPRRVDAAIAAVNDAGWPAVLMVHPWEIDPDPPAIRLPLRLRFAHYFRLSGFRERLRAIMQRSRFTTLSEAAAAVSPGL